MATIDPHHETQMMMPLHLMVPGALICPVIGLIQVMEVLQVANMIPERV